MSYIDYKGKKVYYETHGKGRPLVLLNGIMMSTLSWKVFIDAFSKSNQLILVDFLDQGRTDKMEDASYTQEEQVEVLKTLLDELNINRINVVGISYGGEVALEFAVKYQQYIEKLVLFNTTAKTSPWLRDIGTGWNRSASDPLDYYCTTIPVIYSPQFYTEKSEWMDKRKKFLTENVFNQKPFMDSMIRLTESAEQHDVVDKLPSIHVPTLIVCCENDYITPMSEQKQLNELIKGSQLVMLPNTGHASMYERPVVFASLVLGYINLEQTEFTI
ncbi:alpha/beta fold hydrolase [Anaerocolumna sp.]|uniref:alpha/beta fold hydrolase n=1 Tax=Anaerocolumna sp. TaxID=2041569 RepID=UPI0028A74B1C|nr:alpha/beta hydrolase [Anaerocolumna sp.]